jgi:hypothetical protein
MDMRFASQTVEPADLARVAHSGPYSVYVGVVTIQRQDWACRLSIPIPDRCLYRLCALLSEFLATDPEVSGSIPGATRFSQK